MAKVQLTDRFLSKVNRLHPSGCWLWLGRVDECGYGCFDIGKTSQKKAHRVAYSLFKGPIPHGLELDHLCRIRNCVNPAHLEAVTHAENVRRGRSGEVAAKRQLTKTHCPKGHGYSPENTYTAPKAYTQNGTPSKIPARHCRICRREHNKNYRINKRAKNAQIF